MKQLVNESENYFILKVTFQTTLNNYSCGTIELINHLNEKLTFSSASLIKIIEFRIIKQTD